MILLEKMALAICEADCGRVTDNELARCRALARAAIEAMREPTDGMLDKMNDVWVDAGEVSINFCFADLRKLHAAAIDAALREENR